MSDRYLNLVNSPIGSAVASRVGLPQPAKLRRYSAGDPLLPGPALLGSTAGKPSESVHKMLISAGVEVLDSLPADTTVAAVVLDARSVEKPSDLGALREFLGPAMRALGAFGRVLVLGVPVDGESINTDATRQALEAATTSRSRRRWRFHPPAPRPS